MRKLLILRGAMGVGKSTFIKENHLENYSLCADTIRLMLNAPELTIEYTERIPQFNNKKVWELLYFFLEERMKKGEFTIIDAVHASKEDFTVYKKLAEKYRYRTFILDFTTVKKEEVYKRNALREIYKQVPQASIDKVYKKFLKEQIPNSFKIVKPDEWESILTKEPIEKNKYQNIHIIGDIHGCITPLKEYFKDNPFQEEDAYIFLGDYFDRGIENYETYLFLSQLMEKNNCIFLMGNHEDKLYKYACDDAFKMDYEIKRTIEEFTKNKISKKEIRGFIKKLSQIAYITFCGKTYLISHGGIPYFPKKALDFYSTNSFIYGVDKYDVNIDKLYNDSMEKEEKKIVQMHGHRNYFKNEVTEYPYSYNLDGDIEHGGYLRIVHLNKDGNVTYSKIKNEIYNKNLQEETENYNLVEALRTSKYVYEKELGDSISSFNFTKEAFYNSLWDNLTTKARGLFIDTNTYQCVARSYDKFFNINEKKETALEFIGENFNYPVKFYLKYNGFLGILSLHNEELFFASKSTNKGPYVDYFKKIFYDIYNEKQIEIIKEKLKKEKASFVFEVIDPKNDPHIIKYEKPNLVLLDSIKNKTQFEKTEYNELKEFGSNNKIMTKELVYEAKNKEEFNSIYKKITKEDYKLNGDSIEGFVLEDENHFMVKVKTKYYEEWKYLRNKMPKAIESNQFDTKSSNSLETNFLHFLELKYKNKKVDVEQVNIIEEREEFLKQ